MFQPEPSKRAKIAAIAEHCKTEQPGKDGFSFQHSMDKPEDLSEKRMKYEPGRIDTSTLAQSNQAYFSTPLHAQFFSDKTKDSSRLLNRQGQRTASTEEELLSHDSDNQEESMGAPSNLNSYDSYSKHEYEVEEARQLETLEIFAKDFKQKRIKLGYTQGDVGLAIGQLYGNDFSQTTISRFEALNLSFKNMCKLRPLLEKWLNYANKVVKKAEDGDSIIVHAPVDPSIPQGRRRKKRTSIDQKRRGVLDDMFNKNPKPTSDELHNIAEECALDKEVVRVWFCNRRQKEKRIAMHEQQSQEDVDSHSPPDSPTRAHLFPIRMLPESPASFSPFATTGSSSGGINHLSRGVAPSLLGETRGAQKQEKSHEQRLSGLNFANLPMLQRGSALSSPILPIIQSAQAVQNPNLVSPAYSALDQQQFRKTDSTTASLILSSSFLRSQPSLSIASTLGQEKGSLSPNSLTSSENRSSLAPQNPDASNTRNASTSNNAAVLSSTY